MCGRYSYANEVELFDGRLLRLVVAVIDGPDARTWKARYNIAPSQDVLAVRAAE